MKIQMAVPRALAVPIFCILVICCCAPAPSSASSSADDFLHCLSANVPSQVLLTQSSPSFTSVLVSRIWNPRVFTPRTARPLCIVTATNASHVQAAVVCGVLHGVRLRVRSGGHDYEGLSSRSARPEAFAVVDLAGLRAVRVSRGSATAWVESGATLGELYHAVAGASGNRLAFPGGLCPTIGVGGHLGGGGFGLLQRKYGVAADSVLDAVLVDAKGTLLDRGAMGRNVFWAIRGGGGGGSFGVVLSWRVRLVPVPATVTAFIAPVSADDDEGAAAVRALTRWEEVAPALPDDLFIRVVLRNRTASFQSLYLGTCDALLRVMRCRFPELGVTRAHCREMTWVEAVLYVYVGTGAAVPATDALNRTVPPDGFSKAKSDYVRRPIGGAAWAEVLRRLAAGPRAGMVFLDPYGGAIGGVPEAATPFPHRGGVLYNVQYMNFWRAEREGAARTRWLGDLYEFMAPHVSENPREAYFNYRDLDLGENVVVGNVSSYEAGKVWGEKYFKGNYQRLAMAKAQIDPEDYFRNEQSIPPFVPTKQVPVSTDE